MKKKVLSGILAVAMAAALTACGGSSSTATSKAASEAPEAAEETAAAVSEAEEAVSAAASEAEEAASEAASEAEEAVSAAASEAEEAVSAAASEAEEAASEVEAAAEEAASEAEEAVSEAEEAVSEAVSEASEAASEAEEAASSAASEAEEAASSAASEAEDTADSDVAYIQDKGTLIVGITDFAPMDYKDDDGEWIGFDADMAKKVAEDLGVEVEFVEIDWDNKILELENKSIDVVWNGMTLTDEVMNAMECTNAYCNNAQVVVLPADKAEDYKDAESMKDLTFAVEAGSAGEAAAKDSGLEYTALTTQADTLMEVQAGTSNASIIDLLMAGAMIGEGTSYPDLTHTLELTEEKYGAGCRKGSDLAAYINDEFSKFYEDGTMMEIAEQYGVQESIIEQ